jgi:hypothetical protein
MMKAKCGTMFSISCPRKPYCRFSPRRSATDLAKRSAELLAAAHLFARSVTDHSPCTIYKRLNESDNEDEMHKMFSRKPHPRASAKWRVNIVYPLFGWMKSN